MSSISPLPRKAHLQQAKHANTFCLEETLPANQPQNLPGRPQQINCKSIDTPTQTSGRRCGYLTKSSVWSSRSAFSYSTSRFVFGLFSASSYPSLPKKKWCVCLYTHNRVLAQGRKGYEAACTSTCRWFASPFNRVQRGAQRGPAQRKMHSRSA